MTGPGDDDPIPEPSPAVALGLVQAALVLAAFPAGWLLGPPPLATLSWDWAGLGWGVVAAVPMVGLFFLLYHVPFGPFGPVRRFTEEVVVPILRRCSVFELFALALLAGVGEELLFRGVVQAALTARLDFVAGLALASVLFGMMHPYTLGYVLLTTLFGAYLGLAWVWTGNLLVPVVAHFLYDFVAMVYLTRTPATSSPA